MRASTMRPKYQEAFDDLADFYELPFPVGVAFDAWLDVCANINGFLPLLGNHIPEAFDQERAEIEAALDAAKRAARRLFEAASGEGID